MRTFIMAAALLGTAAAASEPQQIVFARVFPNAGQIGLFIAAADGTDERTLVAAGEVDYNPVWAPDGASIVFTSDRDGSANLFRVKPDGTRAARRRSGVRRSGGVLARWQATGLRQLASWRLRASVDDGPAVAARESADVRTRRRFPAGVVAGGQMDRLRVGSRQLDAVRARAMGAPAPRRSVRRAFRRHRSEADHRAWPFLREPEVGAGRPSRDRVLHDGRADAREQA